MFIGRQKETAAIQRLISQKGFRGGIVYGRRRLGKTELLRHCLLHQNVPCIFFQCLQDSEQGNTEALTSVIEQTLQLSHLHFNSFSDAVRYVFELADKQKLYFVLDEYPYIRKLVPGIDSVLQSLIDSNQSCNLKFFLCGSSIATMEAIQSQNNPLFRRFHLSLLLREMDYRESAEFYPSFSNEDKVRLYAAFGGVPFYNLQIDPSRSVKDNIIALLSGEYSHLVEEITVNLKEELAKVNNANAVFQAIALGAFHYKDILSKSHISVSSILSDILEKLVKMDLVEYIAPINDPTNKQKSGYRISDSTLRFYYNYIYRNLSAKAIMDEKSFYDRFIHTDFETAFVPNVFETIAKQYLIRLNRAGKLDALLIDIGTYWYDNPSEKKNGQFDVVGKRDDGYVFYEVKFTNTKINDQLITSEIEQVEKTTLKPVQYGFISRSGFDLKQSYPYHLISLDDLYD